MTDENKPWLKLRNPDDENETYCKYYVKKFRGYIRALFINYQTVGLFVGVLLLIAMYFLFIGKDKDDFSLLIWCVLTCVWSLGYIGKIVIGLWFWKYTKYVVVTNEGVWLMWHGAFWRKKDYAGKRRFLSPIWSLYDWAGIKITDDDKARPIAAVGKYFDEFDYAVIKSCKLTSLFITRFDGVQEIDFLDKNDAAEILAYAKERRKRKKIKKKDMEIIKDEYEKESDEEYVDDGDE